jgi:hypothetical protein
MCRAFGAHLIHLVYPGLTAGPINYRPFGPDTGVACFMIQNAHAGFTQASTSTFDIRHSLFISLLTDGLSGLKSHKICGIIRHLCRRDGGAPGKSSAFSCAIECD